MPKGATGFKLKVSDNATKALTENPKRVKALLQVYGDALDRSRSADRQVSFRIDVDPEGEVVVTPVEEAIAPPAPVVKDDVEPDIELQGALAAARERGQLRAAEILGGEDMLSADEFAKLLGTTRVTVNTKRHNCQILGLDGAKRGFRFPAWQLDSEGKPYAELAALHERLGGPWAVYRFLVQPHGELGGLTGRQALERGKSSAALEAAESVGRDFR
ncbi:MAG: XRE family transcriptional regulator [Defluviicoccus sp.]|nr:MAG: XRE family transcriptional regulator [Defluviicoccus sp.]